MARQKDFEILGRLIRDGADLVLEPAGNDGVEGFYMGDNFVSILKEELISYGDGEARILIAKLNILGAKKNLALFEEDLKKLKKRVEPEAKREEEGV